MRRLRIRIFLTATLLLGIGIATPAMADSHGNGNADSTIDDSAPNDPWEGFNRSMFAFNEKLDLWILRPVAVGWDFVVPDLVQTGIRNIFSNARFPVIFVNNLLQGKPKAAGEDLGRFLLNTWLGVGGIFDPAKEVGLPGNNEDFGQTLGYWGVPPGPYLVVPFLGPSSPRGVTGLLVDSGTMYMVYPYWVPWFVSSSITATNVVNTRAHYIEQIDEERRAALDFYSFQRNAYVSYRENLVNDREDDETDPADSLYYYEEEDEE